MIVAEPADARVDERTQAHIRVATKYPKTTRAYLMRRGLTAEVIKLSGAIELGPLTGLCERIVDITSRRPARRCARTGSSRSTRWPRCRPGSWSIQRGSSSTAIGSVR